MNSSQPPNKRRRLSNNRTQTNKQVPFPPNTSHPYPKTTQEIEKNLNHFVNNWHSFVHTHLDDEPAMDLNFPNSIHSNTNNTHKNNTSQAITLDSIDNNNNNYNNNNNNKNTDALMDEINKLKTEINNLKTENNKLKQSNNNLLDESCKKDKQLREYKHLLSSEIRQKEMYQLRLKGLAQMIKTGNRAHFERVNMNKLDIRMSETVYNIKQKIIKNHLNKYNNTMHIDINDMTIHSQWIKKKPLKQIIKNHINYNGKQGNNPSKPHILIRKQRERRLSSRNSNNKYKNNEQKRQSSLDVISGNTNGDYDHMLYNFVLGVFKIKKDSHRVAALSTGYQRGLRTLIDIPIGTVIGEYVGVEYTSDEFQSIFNHSNEEAIRNVYAFDCKLKEPTNKGYNEVKMVMDGYGLREMVTAHNQRNVRCNNNARKECEYSAHLLYINDCRLDISIEKPTKEDIKYWNIDFVEADVNGMPKVFLVTRCNVKANTELVTYYGEAYNTCVKQQTEYERMRNSIITLVDNSILRGVDMSNDTWTIE